MAILDHKSGLPFFNLKKNLGIDLKVCKLST